MPKVDIRFRLIGKNVPADHGYHLFSAISEIVPEIHGNRSIGIHLINGRLIGNRLLALTEHSRLTIRTSIEQIKPLIRLAGKTLRLANHDVQVGTPDTRPLIPSARLYSRLVIIKGFTEPVGFLEAVHRQLADMNIQGEPSLVEQSHVAEANRRRSTGSRSSYLRRTIRIRDKEIVGFALRVGNLTADESIRLQEEGIGGRRRFGCGIFIPSRR